MYQYIGIDVSKQTLQVYDGEQDSSFSNEPTLQAFNQFIQNKKRDNTEELVLIFEPTGAYSSTLRKYCIRENLKAKIVNPSQSAYFAKAIGNRSKTDKVDARMLYSFSVLLHDKDCRVPYDSEKANRLGAYINSYALLVSTETGVKNHLHAAKQEGSITPDLLALMQTHLEQIEALKEEILQQALVCIQADPILQRALDNICSIPGVGKISAIHLLYLFLKYPEANRNQITALAGLDPMVRESGTSLHHRMKISKRGSHLVRRVLYCAAMSSVRYNAEWKDLYEAFLARGKQRQLILVAVMRKILLLSHALYRENRLYEERGKYKKTQ
ncbi:MAG TPA: IS110 family transposase [bacterium]|nr:IS110 family transposase [bacterium]